jgi:hypothetical protein
MRKDGADDTQIARFAFQKEQEIQKTERNQARGVRLTRALDIPRR